MTADHSNLYPLASCPDPYEAVVENLPDVLKTHRIEPIGKIPIPSWLRPRPEPKDLSLVTARNMQDFFDSGDMLEITGQIQAFVKEKILPDIPVMLGIDHSSTAGVISALAEKNGPEKLSAVVLDQHFDAIPLSVRLEGLNQSGVNVMSITPPGFSDQFCCGNFWAQLMENGTVLPENLMFIGVADYPPPEESPQGESYRRSYLNFEKRGCGFFPRERFEGDYKEALSNFLIERIKTPNVYVSLDLDVGSYAGTYAARYMDRPGLSERNILDIAGIIADNCRQGMFTIAGLDIMEFNMHFLGLETPDGVKDNTLGLVEKFLTALT